MSLETYNANEASFEAKLKQNRREEDVWETEESLVVLSRERQFSKEGKFRDLLRLKIFLNHIKHEDIGGPIISNSHDVRNFIITLLNNPKELAYSSLGFSASSGPDLEDALVQQKAKEYLEKDIKPKYIGYIENILEAITAYSAKHESEALNLIKSKLELAKTLLKKDSWEEFIDELESIKNYLFGMKDTLELILGRQTESPETRKVLKID